MPEIVRRTFIEERDLVAEESDWRSRELALDARGWSSYCVFLPSRPVLALEAEIRSKLPKSFVQVVPSKSPEGVWIRGARWELEAAIKVLGL